MADQIVLSWVVNVAGTPFGPAAAATALGAVALYQNPVTDPVLGQLFGLTVDADATVAGAGNATRTLTLNMNAVNAPEAPPLFPCHPITTTPPVPPYPLLVEETLGGFFFVTNGLATVPTTELQTQTLAPGMVVQFLSQPGVLYTVLTITTTLLTLTAPYTGTTANTEAFIMRPTPVTLAAIYSSSELDTDDVALTAPVIVAGAGAQTVELTYDDSVGGGPFTVTVSLTGKRPAEITLDLGSIDIAEVISMVVATSGGFENNVGQLTLVEMTAALPSLPSVAPTPDMFRGPITDTGQLLIGRALAYLPPSYFSLAQQGASYPQLAGDFFVSTGSRRVTTSEDQTAALAPGDTIRFASQFALNTMFVTQDSLYVIETVASNAIVLTTAYTGFDYNGLSPDQGQKPDGATVTDQRTAAFAVTPSPATDPTDNQLAGPLAQFIAPATASPPPVLNPATIPVPTFLSDLFTRTLQLALKGTPVVPQPITFLP